VISTLALFFPNIDAPTENRRPSAQPQAGFCREPMGDGLAAGVAALDRGDCPIRGADCASMRSGWTIKARMTSQIGKEQRSGVEGAGIDHLSHTLFINWRLLAVKAPRSSLSASGSCAVRF
jgi:hypothetical protein